MKKLNILIICIAIVSVLLIGDLVIVGIIKNKEKGSVEYDADGENDSSEGMDLEKAENTTEEITTTEEIDPMEGHWFKDAYIMQPEFSDNTIYLEKADMSVFDLETTSGSEEAEAIDPWEAVTLYLDPAEGALNNTSEGEIRKTKQLTSTYMVLINADTGEIVADRDSDKQIYPASMTKIMTVITARDYITAEDLDNEYVVSYEIVSRARSEGMSSVGFLPGDTVTLRDLLYGTIVCSGGDAALALAEYCLGSEEAFVEKMNENAKLLGLSDKTHFTNVVGMFNEDLHTTMQDVAVTMSVAVQDDLLRDVLSTRRYLTSVMYAFDENGIVNTEEDGSAGDTEEGQTFTSIEISNWFLRRIEDKEVDGEVICGKTGYVNQSGCCAASYYISNSGTKYVCVTGNAYSSWRVIYDHVSVYRSFTK